eukprot:4378570-Alexandrium_andersonii.AAC.1
MASCGPDWVMLWCLPLAPLPPPSHLPARPALEPLELRSRPIPPRALGPRVAASEGGPLAPLSVSNRRLLPCAGGALPWVVSWALE